MPKRVLNRKRNTSFWWKTNAADTASIRKKNDYWSAKHKVLHAIVFVGLLIGLFDTNNNFKKVGSLEAYIPTSSRAMSAPVVQQSTLSNESLAHIERAGLVNLSYMDVTDNFTSHPHKGALDEHGHPRYVADITQLRKNPPTLGWNESTQQTECQKNNISVDVYHFPALQRLRIAQSDLPEGVSPSKILCAVYTNSNFHDNLVKLRETWAPKCDGFFAASNATDRALDAVNVLHHGIEEYNNMWQKVRSLWCYIYDNYYDDYDWFHVGGDDMWLIVENLRAYLDSEEIRAVSNGGSLSPMVMTQNQQQRQQVPMYLGCRFANGGNMEDLYNTGGPGYTINRAALKLLVVQGLPRLFTEQRTSAEDVFTARIFSQLNVGVYNTRDELGSERYMHFPPGRSYHGQEPRFYRRYTAPLFPISGNNHSSVHSIAFHYVKDTEEMRRFHATLYGLCPA